MYPSGYTQDTSQDTYPIGNVPKKDRKCARSLAGRQASLAAVAAMATLADVCPHHETERGAAAKVLGRTGSEGVRGGFREQSWKGVCGLRFADASRISAVWGSTFRDLSIGTLHHGASSRY